MPRAPARSVSEPAAVPFRAASPAPVASGAAPSAPSIDPAAVRPAEDVAPLPSGAVVAGHRIDSVLAFGPTGFVYRATELLLQRPVALKEYLVAGCSRRGDDGVQVVPVDPKMLTAPPAAWLRAHDAFVGEARRLGAARHPGLVAVWRLVESHGTLLRVMPLLRGPTLAELPGREPGPLDARLWCARVQALRVALQALHAEGGVHGHLHPRQVMLDGDAQPVLLGFGAAGRALDPRLPSYLLPYVAPEALQWSGRGPLTPASDLYALAALAWFMATGHAPVKAGDRVSGAAFDVRTGLLAALGEAATADPQVRAVVTAVERALSLDPMARPLASSAWQATEAGAVPTRSAAVPVPPLPAMPPPMVLPAAAASAPTVARADAAGQAARTDAESTAVADDAAVRDAIARAIGSMPEPPPKAAVASIATSGPTPDPAAAAGVVPAGAPPPSVAWKLTAAGFVGLLVVSGLLALWWGLAPTAPEADGVLAAGPAAAAPAAAPASPAPSSRTTDAVESALAAADAALRATSTATAAAPPTPSGNVKGTVTGATGTAGTTGTVGTSGTTGTAATAGPAARAPSRPAPAPKTPREACGSRTNFSLLRCMESQCAKPQYARHEQCVRLRATGEIE